jgi:hypothetical protein
LLQTLRKKKKQTTTNNNKQAQTHPKRTQNAPKNAPKNDPKTTKNKQKQQGTPSKTTKNMQTHTQTLLVDGCSSRSSFSAARETTRSTSWARVPSLEMFLTMVSSAVGSSSELLAVCLAAMLEQT